MIIKELKYNKKLINMYAKNSGIKKSIMSMNNIDIDLIKIYRKVINDIDDFTTVVMVYDNNHNMLDYAKTILHATDNICILVSEVEIYDLDFYVHRIHNSKYYIYILENNIGEEISNLLISKGIGVSRDYLDLLFKDEFLEELGVEIPKEIVKKEKKEIRKGKSKKKKSEVSKGEKVINTLLLLVIIGVLILIIYTLNQPFVYEYL